MQNKPSRRHFLKTNARAVAGLTMASIMPKIALAEEHKPVRIGVVGTGNRARGLMSNLLGMKNIFIPAVCDIDPKALAAAQQIVTEKGQSKPEGYSGPTDYKKLMDRDDLDAVLICTPWDLHTPMSVYGMKAEKIIGCEVPIAYTLEECWQLIKTWEETGTPCMQLENWSFRSDNLAVLKMIRAGLLGEITHTHCAYSHDCIDHWYFERGTGNSRWAAQYLIDHNRAQYPTHQQGPVLSWMDINCGDYYDTITSTATDGFSIYDYFKRTFPDHPNGKKKYKQGDIVTTVVRTKKGKSIVINFDMQSPRPYDNRWTVQGTRGIYNQQRNAVYLTGKSPQYHEWEAFPPYDEQYKHAWAESAFGGHGGADGIMLSQLVRAVREKKPLPLDLYDGVLMAAIGPLSEMSIAQESKVIQVPDFTRGQWNTRKPSFALET
jgi:predicted dehydrogenase